MKKLLLPARALALTTLLALGACRKEAAPYEDCATDLTGCTTAATVRDLTGLDGCGKVLELANGQRLEPHGTAWTSFASANGQRVIVGYTPVAAASICMVGQAVEITCIRPAQ